ncbi:MAG TPA: CopD family protein [Ktedonobacteraceae bacterium]|nr:CopD family protein [Ktedonobacteraceae bacterium]
MLEIRLIVRAVHLLAAAAWVGGSFFYLVVAIPALRSGGPAPGVAAQMAALFRRMVTICTGVLLLSGAYLTFDRLTTTTLGWSYLAVLALKIILALCMFALAIYLGQSNIRRLAKRSTRLSKAAPQLMLVVGILVFVLGALLNILFETSAHP